MASADEEFDDVGKVLAGLTALGLTPVLVGGMALVMLGSRRVTRDFDFVIRHPGDSLDRLLDVLYDHGLELASRVNEGGDVTSTIGNRRVAAARLRIDAPSSAYFLNPKTEVRIDLLFDFPIPAATLVEHATRVKIRSHMFTIASESDLLQLKKIANDERSLATDAVDIAFLEARRKSLEAEHHE